MTKIIATDPDMRLPSGLKLKEAVERARQWWDREGRHVARNPEFRDPDIGAPSGIMRGLTFDELSREEAAAVIEAWHHDKVMALIPAEFGGTLKAPKAGRLFKA